MKKEQVVSQPVVASGIQTIKENFGKNTIIIKDNIIFRCSTGKYEKGPKCLLDYELPKYGKMRKFVIKDDGVYELITEENYETSTFAKHVISDKVDMDVSELEFDLNNVWNKAKEKVEA